MNNRKQVAQSQPKTDGKNPLHPSTSNHKRSFSGDRRDRKQKFHNDLLENGDGGTPKKKAKIQRSEESPKESSHTFFIDLTDGDTESQVETREIPAPAPKIAVKPLPESTSQILYDRPDFVLDSTSNVLGDQPPEEMLSSSSEEASDVSELSADADHLHIDDKGPTAASPEDSARAEDAQMSQGEIFIPLVADKASGGTSRRGVSTPAKTASEEINRPTTPGGQHMLQDRYLSVFNNEVTSGSSPGNRLPPWTRRPYQKGHLCLHDEMVDFCKYMEPTQAETLMRKDLVSRVSNSVTSIFPDAQPEVFGSFATNLYLPTSDVDMVVIGVEPTSENLWALASVFEGAGTAQFVQVIDRARVPLVKFIDGPTGIQVDISFNQLTGLANGRIVSKYLTRGLNEPYFGGLGSYSLLLLVVSFFQLQVHKSHSAPESNMGYMLIEFFDFYGRVFNWYTTGIRVSNGGCYFNKMDRDWFDASKPYLPSIEDPNDSDNDVGHSSFRILHVRQMFQDAFMRLTMRPRDDDYAPTLLCRIIKPSPHIEQSRQHFKRLFTPGLVDEIDPNLSQASQPPQSRQLEQSSKSRENNSTNSNKGHGQYGNQHRRSNNGNYRQNGTSGSDSKTTVTGRQNWDQSRKQQSSHNNTAGNNNHNNNNHKNSGQKNSRSQERSSRNDHQNHKHDDMREYSTMQANNKPSRNNNNRGKQGGGSKNRDKRNKNNH